MKKKIITLALLVAFPIFANALSLDQAKSSGLVGETPSGYLASVSASSSPEVKALIQDINSKRKEQYQQIAKKNGTNISAVEKLAGKKAIEKTPAGQYVKASNGWVKK